MKMRVLKTITGVCMLLVCGGVWGDTCIPTAFNVSYSCNGGTLVGTLPADTTAQYGATFKPTAISTSMCTAPSGYIYAGQAVIVDGETVASYDSTFSRNFTYYYTTDIEIGPHWVAAARPETLASYLYNNGLVSTNTSGANGTWTVGFNYGAVSGVSKCTSVVPENSATGDYTGWIADYNTIQNASANGIFCYCKMTEPYFAASPWAYCHFHASASACAKDCARECGEYVRTFRVLRASVFAGAISE